LDFVEAVKEGGEGECGFADEVAGDVGFEGFVGAAVRRVDY